jgi:hypothetical protein
MFNDAGRREPDKYKYCKVRKIPINTRSLLRWAIVVQRAARTPSLIKEVTVKELLELELTAQARFTARHSAT